MTSVERQFPTQRTTTGRFAAREMVACKVALFETRDNRTGSAVAVSARKAPRLKPGRRQAQLGGILAHMGRWLARAKSPGYGRSAVIAGSRRCPVRPSFARIQ